MPRLADYLELTPAAARAQWRSVVARGPRPDVKGFRQADFLPVETLLCLASMLLVNHRRFGGSTSHLAPSPVPELARLTARTAASVLAKMANLDGSRPNGARHEVEAAAALLGDVRQLAAAYQCAIAAARAEGLGVDRLPDFLGLEEGSRLWLAGQEELPDREIEQAVAPQMRSLAGRMGGADEVVTERLLVAAARIGQHRFAEEVLRNFAYRCGFCGLTPGTELERHGLLVASHIKPWRVCTDRERLDRANGISACPTHDSAFDAGLLWVNGGHRIHAVDRLRRAIHGDAGMAASFARPPLATHLLVPAGCQPPGATYLDWHRTHVVAA